jgi:hypothetical protein
VIPARGLAGAELDQAKEQGEEVRELWASGIGAGWCGWGGFRREVCGGASVLVIAGRRKGVETIEGKCSA